MTLGFTILIITYDNYIILKVTLLAEDQQNLNLYRDFIRPHICWRGCESTNLGMQMLGQFCLASTFQVPVKVPACVSWAFIATSCTEVRHIYIYTYLCMLYATFLLAAGATPLMLMEFFCLFFLGCSARLSFPPHLLEELQRNPGRNVLVVVFRRIGQDVFTSKHSYNVTSQLCMEYTLWTPTYQVSWVAFFGWPCRRNFSEMLHFLCRAPH